MKGTVSAVNYRRKLVATRTEHGYTLFDLLDDQIVDVGHAVSGDLDAVGQTSLVNETTGKRMKVSIQAVRAGETNMRGIMAS
jgi:hypothetical protein